MVRRVSYPKARKCKHLRTAEAETERNAHPRTMDGHRLRATAQIRALWNEVRAAHDEPAFLARSNEFAKAVFVHVRNLPKCAACDSEAEIGQDLCSACLGRRVEPFYHVTFASLHSHTFNEDHGEWQIFLDRGVGNTTMRRILIERLARCLDEAAGQDLSDLNRYRRTEKMIKMFPPKQLNRRRKRGPRGESETARMARFQQEVRNRWKDEDQYGFMKRIGNV